MHPLNAVVSAGQYSLGILVLGVVPGKARREGQGWMDGLVRKGVGVSLFLVGIWVERDTF